VGEGWFAKVFLVEHRKTRGELILKAVHKDSTTVKDFIREFHYSYNLGLLNGGRVIARTFDILFEAEDCLIFAQEYAQFGDLTSNVSDIGIGEIYAKKVAKQLASALDFVHDQDLVHRDVKLDNVLIFKSDFSKVKLADFGECRRKGTYVVRFNEWVPYCPPEVVDTLQDTPYSVEFHQDTWQFGVLLFLCLTGKHSKGLTNLIHILCYSSMYGQPVDSNIYYSGYGRTQLHVFAFNSSKNIKLNSQNRF
jgi:serine/threonine-protein kinase SBK